MENDNDWGRRARNQSEGLRWERSQQLLEQARASALANAQHFIAVLHQYRAQPYAVYRQSDPGKPYQLLAERGWMIHPPRLPSRAGIVLTEDGHFYWYFQLKTADRQTIGVKHQRFYAVTYNPFRPGIEVSPFEFSDINILGKESGLPAAYLELLIELLEGRQK